MVRLRDLKKDDITAEAGFKCKQPNHTAPGLNCCSVLLRAEHAFSPWSVCCSVHDFPGSPKNFKVVVLRFSLTAHFDTQWTSSS